VRVLATVASRHRQCVGKFLPSVQPLPRYVRVHSLLVKLALSTLCENPLRPTGLTTLFHEFVSHSLRLYPDVEWVVFAGPDSPWRVSDRRVQLVRRFPSNSRPLARLWADHFRVGPAARRLGCDALLTIGFMPARAPLPVVMHVFTLHHLARGGGLRRAYRTVAVGRGLREASLVVANSEWTAAGLRAGYAALSAPVVVSPEGVQHERFRVDGFSELDRGARESLKLPEKFVLWSSNFYPYKRADRAIAAYAALPEGVRETYPLVLVGGDWHGGLAAARAAAQSAGVEGQTRFLGWIEDRWLPSCYRLAAALILSTTEETFGRSVLEALACGCPCVLQDLPVLREVAGDAVRYVDYANTPAAAAAIAGVLSDQAQRETMIRAGLARAQAFSFERLARERIEAIWRVVGK
jgi:glycosyltransferase involved in cell wall biosynthesis